MPNEMFKNSKLLASGLVVPKFKLIQYGFSYWKAGAITSPKEDKVSVTILSKHGEDNWIQEYHRDYPATYDMLDCRIKLIEKTIKENYFFFRNKLFETMSMFSINGIMFKNPSLQYATKLLSGDIIDTSLLRVLPLVRGMSFDIIDNKGGLKFYEKGELAYSSFSDDGGGIAYLDGKMFLIPLHLPSDADVRQYVINESSNVIINEGVTKISCYSS